MKLSLKDVSVRLGGKQILKNISFDVEQGDFVSVLGPSGCGKSTLLKTIAGIVPCESGRVYINGNDMAHIPPHKRGTVIVFQDVRLFPHMSVADNVGFPMKVKGLRKKDYTGKVMELLESVRLSGYEGRTPGKLSGGEAQRVALARAMAAEPAILLLDEPYSGLDENLRFDMRLLVSDLRKKYDITAIMVTHDKEEALSASDTVMVMNSGSILQRGNPKSVYENPNSLEVAKYFGDAAFVNGVVKGGAFVSDEFSFDCAEDDGKYILMVRYDALEMREGSDFRLMQVIYNGVREELLFEHARTMLRIKYSSSKKQISAEGDTASFYLDSGKIRLFRMAL